MYAAARSLSLRNNLELVIDDVSGFIYDYRFKRTYQLGGFKIHCRKATSLENLTLFPILFRLLVKAISRFFPEYSKLIYVQQIVWDYDPSLVDGRPGKDIYLDGQVIIADLKILVNSKDELKVVDIIHYNVRGEITRITAYKG